MFENSLVSPNGLNLGFGVSEVPQNSTHKWDSIISLISQGVGAWGKNPSSQVYAGVGIVPASPRQRTDYSDTPIYPQGVNPYLQAQTQYGSAGGIAGSGIDGIVSWLGANPMLVLLIAGGLYLLFRDPPSKR